MQGATVGDKVFHGHDEEERLDLAGNAAPGHFGAEVGDFPEAVQYLFAVQVQAVLSICFLVDKLLLYGGAVLEHVGADARFGFDVGGGAGFEAGDFGGSHGRSLCQRGPGGQRPFPDR